MFQMVFPSIILSSWDQNCTYSVRHLSDQYCYLLLTWLNRLAAGSSIGLTQYVQFWAPVDGRKTRLKHVERLTEINKFEKSCILLVVLWEYAYVTLDIALLSLVALADYYGEVTNT